ncbi:hypothetical protein QJQ45_023861 [Haematococcus lacustris]|nr:hypothetical protein QJQ45_023861 [Haematococcus lacustris]
MCRFLFDGKRIEPSSTPAMLYVIRVFTTTLYTTMAEGGGDNAVPKQESAAINIVVRDQAGNEVHFKIKTHTKFEKVFNAYCDKKGQDPRAVKCVTETQGADNAMHTTFSITTSLMFLFDGQRVEPSSTPATHEMEDGDIIDCMIEQIGGAHGPPMLQGRRSKGISPGSA